MFGKKAIVSLVIVCFLFSPLASPVYAAPLVDVPSSGGNVSPLPPKPQKVSQSDISIIISSLQAAFSFEEGILSVTGAPDGKGVIVTWGTTSGGSKDLRSLEQKQVADIFASTDDCDVLVQKLKGLLPGVRAKLDMSREKDGWTHPGSDETQSLQNFFDYSVALIQRLQDKCYISPPVTVAPPCDAEEIVRQIEEIRGQQGLLSKEPGSPGAKKRQELQDQIDVLEKNCPAAVIKEAINLIFYPQGGDPLFPIISKIDQPRKFTASPPLMTPRDSYAEQEKLYSNAPKDEKWGFSSDGDYRAGYVETSRWSPSHDPSQGFFLDGPYVAVLHGENFQRNAQVVRVDPSNPEWTEKLKLMTVGSGMYEVWGGNPVSFGDLIPVFWASGKLLYAQIGDDLMRQNSRKPLSP